MKPRINMITLGVVDIEKAAQFYERGLGLPRMPFVGGAVFFMLNGSWLSLYPWNALAEDAAVTASGTGFSGISLAHVVSSKEEVRSVINQAVESAGKLIKPAQDVFWGGYSGYFADPDGHLWEVAWNPHFWPGPKEDELEKSRNSDGVVKSSRSRLANPEESGVLKVRRSDEG